MSEDFESEIIKAFANLNVDRFRVTNPTRHLFTCGGPFDVKSTNPLSFRDRFLGFTASNQDEINRSIILAEDFLDYFKDGYPNLFVFEEEIARVSTLVIIFLESPGSLVELGIFSAIPDIAKKLLVIAPQDKVEKKDSFIYLGPLSDLRRKDESSVAIYPFPENGHFEFEENHLRTLCSDIQEKIKSNPATSRFDKENAGHLALLISEIVRVCYPVQRSEIEAALEALTLNSSGEETLRRINLLSKLGFIDCKEYSSNYYYYPCDKHECTVTFSDSRAFDLANFRISLAATYKDSMDSKSTKRQTALKSIRAKESGEKQ